jgi:hypothetical protein
MIAPSTIHVRPSVVVAGRGLAVDDDAGPGAGDALDDGREVPGQVVAGYSLMPKFVLGSAKNEWTQPHPQRPIDRNLYAGLRRPRYRLSTQWCLANYSDPLAGGSRRHKMTRA